MICNGVESDGTVLVIDDEPEILEILVSCASRARLRAIGLTSTAGVEEVLQTENVFLFSLDFRMPREDGLSFYERMCRNGVRIPAVLISANSDSAIIARAKALGMQDVLEKPFSPKAVQELFKKYFDLRAPNAARA